MASTILPRQLYISAATVSRALKEHPAIHKNACKSVFDLAAQLGYYVNNFASNLPKQRTNSIGTCVQTA